MRQHGPADVDLRDPGVFRRWSAQQVRFSDTDMLGHVNNVAVAALHESGRVSYGYGLSEHAPESSNGFVLARLEIDYLAELHYPAEVRVGAALLEIGRTSMRVGTGIFTADDRCVSTAVGVLVHRGPTGSMPLEGAFRELLEGELPGGRPLGSAG